LTLESGFFWNYEIELNGFNLGWLTIETDTGVTIQCGNLNQMIGYNGAILPRIVGDFDKNGNGYYFMKLYYGSKGYFSGTISGMINRPFSIASSELYLRGTLTKKSDVVVEDYVVGIIATDGARLDARDVIVPYIGCYKGSIINFYGGTATLSQTKNTITANGIIFQD
jgi:hypothetical protein